MKRNVGDLRVQVTQAAFTVRMFAVVVALLGTVGETMTLRRIMAYAVALGLSYVGLTRIDLVERARRHPSIAMLDAVILAGATLLSGARSPLSLALLTTAIILGLWVEVWGGAIIIVTLIALHVWGVAGPTALRGGPIDLGEELLVTPFLFLAFWYLGITIRRSLDAQAASRAALLDTVRATVQADERTRLSQELHDSLAKSLQGIMLTASSLPAHLDRSPEQAMAQAKTLETMAAQAVTDVRVVMGKLRDSPDLAPLPEVVEECVASFGARTGRHVRLTVDPDSDTTVEPVRHELLRILEELLDNAHRHAGPCRIDVALDARGEDLILSVSDDGRGVSDELLLQAQEAGHYGVSGIRERVARVGGTFNWKSSPGRGTAVTCAVHRKGLVEREL